MEVPQSVHNVLGNPLENHMDVFQMIQFTLFAEYHWDP